MANDPSFNSPSRLVAQCRSRSGNIMELAVHDLSLGGCMVERLAWSVRPGDHVLIRLPGLSFQPASVLWVEGEFIGIEFDQPLYEPVMAHVLKEFRPRKTA
jgi:hypothetical protein